MTGTYLLNSNNVTLIVQSPGEVEYYSSLIKNKVFFIPYCADIDLKRQEIKIELPFSDYFFSGGYTNRDYHLIIECAKQNLHQNFIIVASSLNRCDFPEKLSSNVYVLYDIPNEYFIEILAQSKCVIVPLKENVGASGQLLCVDAIRLKKPVIYCNISSINYYFESNESYTYIGFSYKMNHVESICSAVDAFSEKNPEEIKKLSEDAYENFKTHFSIECRNKHLVDIILDN